MTERRELIAKANPNRHGYVKLIRYTDTAYETEAEYQSIYVVKTPGDEDGWDFDTEEQARAFYDKEVARLQNEPNWQAQAEYDERWGTDNGYAPWQINQEY